MVAATPVRTAPNLVHCAPPTCYEQTSPKESSMIRSAVLIVIATLAVLGALAAVGPFGAAHAAPDAPANTAPGKAAPSKADLLTAEKAAWDTAQPVMQRYCAKCHILGGSAATAKKLKRFNITSYPVSGNRAATAGFSVREALGLTGKSPRMPSDQPGAVKGDDLAKVKAWTDAWVAADQAGAHAQ
jgi:hypothetical protein